METPPPKRKTIDLDALCIRPLSERCTDCYQDTNYIDELELLKESRMTEDEVQQVKDAKAVLDDTEDIIKFGLKNSKEQHQYQIELKALLEHEQKIIQQILERAKKFKDFKDEAKESADKFEDEHSKRIPFYTQFLKQLAELPETQNVTQEGMPKAVQAKILYNIVENTTHAANNTIVQLSMEKTLMNDMDLSMEKLRNFATFMITNYRTWKKNIGSQENTLTQIIEYYHKYTEDINKLRTTERPSTSTKDEERKAGGGGGRGGGGGGMRKDEMLDVMKSIEERLISLESELKTIKSQTALCCPPGMAQNPQDQSNRVNPGEIHYSNDLADPCANWQDPYLPRQDPFTQQNHCGNPCGNWQDPHPPQQDPFLPWQDPYPPRQNPFPPQQNPYPPHHNPYGARQDPYPPQQNPYPPQHTFNSCPPCPGPDRPNIYSRSRDFSPSSPYDRLHAGQDQYSAHSLTPLTSKYSKTVFSPKTCSPELPNTFNQGSRQPSPDIDISCPQLCSGSPLESNYLPDDFTPDSLDIFQGIQRYTSTPNPEHQDNCPESPGQTPLTGDQHTSAELLCKIQEDLQNLSQRNNHLKDLYSNFRQMRKLLMEEMDKALRLNQKLQNNLRNLTHEEEYVQC